MIAEDKMTIEVEPKMFDEALNHPDEHYRRKWRQAITKKNAYMSKW